MSSETQVAHPNILGLTAQITLRTLNLGPWTSSDFIVTFRCNRTGGRSGSDLKPESLELLNALTPSEGEVALLVAEGRRNQEIARQLGKSLRTVEFQLNVVYKKLGLRSRTQLTRLLV